MPMPVLQAKRFIGPFYSKFFGGAVTAGATLDVFVAAGRDVPGRALACGRAVACGSWVAAGAADAVTLGSGGGDAVFSGSAVFVSTGVVAEGACVALGAVSGFAVAPPLNA